MLLLDGLDFDTIGTLSGWIATGVIILVIFASRKYSDTISSSRQELLDLKEVDIDRKDKEIEDLKKTILRHEVELEQKNADIQEQRSLIQSLTEDKFELARENHTLLDVSIRDLKTVKEQIDVIATLQDKLHDCEDKTSSKKQ